MRALELQLHDSLTCHDFKPVQVQRMGEEPVTITTKPVSIRYTGAHLWLTGEGNLIHLHLPDITGIKVGFEF